MLSRAQIVSIHQHSCGKARNHSLLHTGVQRPGLHRRACALILALAGHCSPRASADQNNQPLAELCSVPVGSVQSALPQGRRPPSGQDHHRGKALTGPGRICKETLQRRADLVRAEGKAPWEGRVPHLLSSIPSAGSSPPRVALAPEDLMPLASALPTYPLKARTHMHTCEHTKVHTCIHMYIHVYTHCTHAYSYTHVYIPTLLNLFVKTAVKMCNDVCVKYYKGAHLFICQLEKQRSKKTTVTPAVWEDREEGLKRGLSFLTPDTRSSQKAHGTRLNGVHLAPLLLPT